MGELASARGKLGAVDDTVEVGGAPMLVMSVPSATMSVFMVVVAVLALVAVRAVVPVDAPVLVVAVVVVIVGMFVPMATGAFGCGAFRYAVQIGHIVVMVLMLRVQGDVEVAAIDAGKVSPAYADLVTGNGKCREHVAKPVLVCTKIK